MESSGKSVYRYCVVPKCNNTTKTAPQKVFFLVPRNANIRLKWCKAMKRDEFKNPKLSATSCLYCCEDHFDLEKDTENFIAYQIMSKQQGVPVTLRLRKGVLPHKFQCQKGNEPKPVREAVLQRQRLRLLQGTLSEAATREVIEKTNLCQGPGLLQETLSEAATSEVIEETNLCEGPADTVDKPIIKEINYFEAGPSSSSHDVFPIENKSLACDKAVQVNTIKPKTIKYRSKGVNVGSKTKNVALSPFLVPVKNTSTSPIKTAQIAGLKRKLFPDIKSIDNLSTTSQSTSISSEYEQESTSSEASWSQDNEDRQFKNVMLNAILIAVEKEPKMMLGLPKDSYHLIKLLSDNIPVPTIDILITLKKIKLNESFDILAIHFGYTQSTISRIFSKTVIILAEKMKELIVWPKPSDIVKHLPIAFRARYSKVVSIIDCLEIEIEKPSNAIHQSLTWSQYKKCNTLKYLISCTPDGLVNFISEGFGGRASDIIIVENCRYLECLPPNTAVMADRGFKDLSHLIEKKKCTLIRPPSVFKSTASTKHEVKQSKRIAALRIHVERVINRLREFHMLLPRACVHHSLVMIVDEVIVIACGIINIQNVLIKK